MANVESIEEWVNFFSNGESPLLMKRCVLDLLREEQIPGFNWTASDWDTEVRREYCLETLFYRHYTVRKRPYPLPSAFKDL